MLWCHLRKFSIEEDNFEKGLTQTLIAAGIRKEDIVTSLVEKVRQNGENP